MSVQNTIETKIQNDLSPVLLLVENESHMHGGPATESHYKLTVVADAFKDLSLVKRHQHIYSLLETELANGVHALALHLYTPEDWEQRGGSAPESPDCRGGSKSDS